jgi:hypothetical protein
VPVPGAWLGGWCRRTSTAIARISIQCTLEGSTLPEQITERRPKGEPPWTVRSLTTGHWPMLSQPEALLNLLLDLANGEC